MAVVEINSDLITDQRFDQNPPDPNRARGRPVVAVGTVANLVSDSAGSLYHLCDLPADAILSSGTVFSTAAWGFLTVQVGTKTLPTALINAARGALISPIIACDSKHGLPAWQQLGLAAQPANNLIELWANGPAAATIAGSMPFEVHYRTR